jgi:hypothetical protein
MDWRWGSRSTAPALQLRSPEFKLQYHNKKTKTENTNMNISKSSNKSMLHLRTEK